MGREEARTEIAAGLTAFPNLELSLQQVVAEPPHVSVFWSMDAVHEGPFLHIPPTQHAVTVSGMGLFTIHEGKIVRGVHLWDLAGVLRVVNLLPALPDSNDEKASIFK